VTTAGPFWPPQRQRLFLSTRPFLLLPVLCLTRGPFISDNKDIQIPSKHNRFIILYHFLTTCFDSLESSSGPLVNWPKTI